MLIPPIENSPASEMTSIFALMNSLPAMNCEAECSEFHNSGNLNLIHREKVESHQQIHYHLSDLSSCFYPNSDSLDPRPYEPVSYTVNSNDFASLGTSMSAM